jgi:hypothetical protein
MKRRDSGGLKVRSDKCKVKRRPFACQLLTFHFSLLTALAFCLLVFTFCLSVHAQQSPVIDRTAFTFTRYDLQLTLTPAEHKLAASGKLTMRNTSHQPQKNVALQISSTLSWESIEVTETRVGTGVSPVSSSPSKPAQYLVEAYTSDIDHTGQLSEAIVQLPTPLPPGGSVELAVRYSGTVTQNSARLERVGAPPEVRNRQDWDRIDPDYSAIRGAGFVVWYPVAMPAASISHENDYADTMAEWSAREQQAVMGLNINAPSATRIVTSGEALPYAGPCTQQRTCSAFRWSPLGLTAPSFALAPFQSIAPLPQFQIHYLAASTEGARSYGEIAKAVAPLISDWFGPPRQNAGVVQLPETNWSAYESGATLLSPLPNSLSPQATQMTEVVLAHQLTHASLPSPRPWIFEGAAHFAQVLQRQRQGGRPAALQYLSDQLPTLQEIEKQANSQGHRGPSLINTTDDVYYRTKAMYCWWMLRDIIGDAALQKAFARYRSEDDRDPVYIEHLLEAEAHKPLDWFFNSWIFSDQGLPDFTITAVSTRQNISGTYTAAVTVENSGGAEAEVPVALRSDVSEVFGRVRVPGNGRATVRIQIGQYPVTAMVNDGSVPETNLDNNSFKVPAKQP